MPIFSVINKLFEPVESKSLSFSDHAYSFKSLFVLTLIVSAAAVTTAVLDLPAAFGLVVAASTLGIMTILSGIRGLWGVSQARLQTEQQAKAESARLDEAKRKTIDTISEALVSIAIPNGKEQTRLQAEEQAKADLVQAEEQARLQVVIDLQSFVRGHKARKTFQALKEEKAAATVVQSFFRGHQARKTFQALKEEKAAATVLQSLVRGHQARKTFQALKEEKAQAQAIVESFNLDNPIFRNACQDPTSNFESFIQEKIQGLSDEQIRLINKICCEQLQGIEEHLRKDYFSFSPRPKKTSRLAGLLKAVSPRRVKPTVEHDDHSLTNGSSLEKKNLGQTKKNYDLVIRLTEARLNPAIAMTAL